MFDYTIIPRRTIIPGSSGGPVALSVFSVSINGTDVDPASYITGETVALIAPTETFPFFKDYAENTLIADWYTEPTETSLMFHTLQLDRQPEDSINATSVSGDTLYHHATPEPDYQLTGDITIRGIVTTPSGAVGQRRLISCEGVTAPTTAAENVLYRFDYQIGASNTVLTFVHESGTDVTHNAQWTLPFPLLPDREYDLCATRTLNVVRVFIDGVPLSGVTATTAATDDGAGNVTFTSSPSGGSTSVLCLERITSLVDVGSQIITEVLNAARAPAAVTSQVDTTRDPRIVWGGTTDATIRAQTADAADIMFITPSDINPTKLNEYVGTYTATWSNGSATTQTYLNGVIVGNGLFSNTDPALQTLAGGGDYVYRYGLVWSSATLSSDEALCELDGTNPCSQAILTSTGRLRFTQTHGAGVGENVEWTLPFSPVSGDALLLSIGQEDNADGTQTVRAWINGEQLVLASTTGTDNLDNSATLTDGAPAVGSNFQVVTAGGADFRSFQITAGTTNTATEELHANVLLGGTGRAV